MLIEIIFMVWFACFWHMHYIQCNLFAGNSGFLLCQSNNLFASEKKKTETFIMFKNLGIQKEDFSKKYSINFIKVLVDTFNVF